MNTYLKESIHRYLSNREYISSSRLKLRKRSCYHFMNPEFESTQAMAIGTMIHEACLEPHLFERKYTTINQDALPNPLKDFRDQENKDYKKQLEQEAKDRGLTLINEKEYIRCQRISSQIQNCKGRGFDIFRNAIQSGSGLIEHSFYTTCPDTGLKVKGRPDLFDPQSGFVFDLKTTTNASPRLFSYDSRKYDYPLQAVHHMQTIQPFFEVKLYVYIVIEKRIFNQIAMYYLTPDDISKLTLMHHDLKVKACECLKQNSLQGYEEHATDPEDGLIPLELPFYYFDE